MKLRNIDGHWQIRHSATNKIRYQICGIDVIGSIEPTDDVSSACVVACESHGYNTETAKTTVEVHFTQRHYTCFYHRVIMNHRQKLLSSAW